MKYIDLNNGTKMPQLGLGTWNSEPGDVGKAIKFAIVEAGYKHIDCAPVYRNEPEIGEAFAEIFSGDIQREDIFITSKLWNNAHHEEDVESTCRQTLADLKLDYLDLYLIHWGVSVKKAEGVDGGEQWALDRVPIAETWAAMESLVEIGLVKSIGVSNFTAVLLNDLLAYANIPPAMNQIELHPYNAQDRLVQFCHENNVAVTAYSPLGRPGQPMHNSDMKNKMLTLVKNPVVLEIAEAVKKTPAQVLLRFEIERGIVCIPKSTHEGRIKENIDVFDFELSDEQTENLLKLDCKFRFVNPVTWKWMPYFD